MRSGAAFAVIAVLSATVTLDAARPQSDPSIVQRDRESAARTITPMSDERFWTVVRSTTMFEHDSDRQIVALRASLRNLSIEDIEAYEAAFDG